MTFSPAVRIGAALTTLASGWALRDRVKFSQKQADIRTDGYVMNTQYGVAKGDYYQSSSGYNNLEKGASWWRRMRAFGPFHVKVLFKRWKNKATQFINSVNQPLGWLAAGSFLCIHPKAYKVVTEPTKWLGKLGAAIGLGLRNLVYTPGIGGAPGTWNPKVVQLMNWLGSSTPSSLSKKLGIIALPLTALYLIIRKTERVGSGQEALDTMRPNIPIGEVQDALYGHW